MLVYTIITLILFVKFFQWEIFKNFKDSIHCMRITFLKCWLWLVLCITDFILKLPIQETPKTGDAGWLAPKPHFLKRRQARDWLRSGRKKRHRVQKARRQWGMSCVYGAVQLLLLMGSRRGGGTCPSSRAVGSRKETGRSVWSPSHVPFVNDPSGVSIEWINWGPGGLFGAGWGVVSGKVESCWCPSGRDF